MTPQAALAAVREVFRSVPRPELMIRGTCSCCECAEHNLTLLSHTPDTITLQELGSAAWDPICFASDAAFAYYLPAMIRLAFEDPVYAEQLLFHLNCPDRVVFLNRPQAASVLVALWVLVDRLPSSRSAKERLFDERSLEEAIQKLEQKAAESD